MGVSIIWCAMGGWILSERKRLAEHDAAEASSSTVWRMQSTTLERLVVLCDVGAIAYYAVVLPILTTVAHVSALILGATLSLLSIRLYDEPAEPEAASATPLIPTK